MSRSLLSATELVHRVIDDLKPFTDMLPQQDRLILSTFAEHALDNRAAIANADSLLPLEATLLIILLEEHKRTQRIYRELCAEIERLKVAAECLQEFARVEDASS